MTIADWMRLSRSQTAAVEGAGLPLAVYLGGAPLWSLPFFVLIGILVHWAGFAANGISDLKRDREDPHKFGHPLVAGRITEKGAWAWVLGLEAIVLLFFGLVTTLRGTYIAWLPMLWFILAGYLYNYTAKAHKALGVVFISSSFAALFLAFGLLWAGHGSPIMWAITFFAFWYVAYQISVAGDIKDFQMGKERNVLRAMGARLQHPPSGPPDHLEQYLDPNFYPGMTVFLYGLALSFAKAIALGIVAGMVGGSLWGQTIFFVSAIVSGVYNMLLLTAGPFDHPWRMKVMGAGEAMTYVLLVIALLPTLWPWLWIAAIILPVGWFVGNNRWLWSTGSAWAPGV